MKRDLIIFLGALILLVVILLHRCTSTTVNEPLSSPTPIATITPTSTTRPSTISIATPEPKHEEINTSVPIAKFTPKKVIKPLSKDENFVDCN